jgi:hypothetical protein
VDEERGRDGPLERTARHSASDFSTGWDMAGVAVVLKREERKGMVGIDLRIVVRVRGWRVRYCVTGRRAVRLLKV